MVLHTDIEIETEIIKLFVQKQYQKRIIYEISSRKDYDIMWHHFNNEQKFKKECLQKIFWMGEEALEKYLFELSGKKEVYYMGHSARKKMMLKEAVTEGGLWGIGIIYCGNGIGYYVGEEERAETPRYILRAKK